jgi:hypothetical protein
MRKYFAFFVVALCALVFSSPAFAGKYEEECGDFKGEKRLYGLCIAFQNALHHEDEEAMEDIFANWQKWVDEDGEPQLPGYPYPDEEEGCPEEQDFCCPCWSELAYSDLCGLGDKGAYLILENASVTGGTVFFRGESETTVFAATAQLCGINITDLEGNVVDEFFVDGAEYSDSDAPIDCVADIQIIAEEDFCTVE